MRTQSTADPHKLLSGSDPTAAFRLSLGDPKLRLPAASGAVIVGVKSLGHPEGRIYPGPWPPERPQMVKAATNERIVACRTISGSKMESRRACLRCIL